MQLSLYPKSKLKIRSLMTYLQFLNNSVTITSHSCSDWFALDSFHDWYFLAVSLERIPSLQLLKFHRSVLIKELIDAKVTSSDPDLDLVLLNAHIDSFRAKGVSAIALTHEHNLQFVSVWVVIDELSHFMVDLITLDWHIDSNSCLKIDNVVSKRVWL